MTRTILITGARAPVALHLARLLCAAGERVLLADSLKRPLAAASRCHAGYHRLPPPRFAPGPFTDALVELIAREGITDVLPTCEEVFHLAIARDRRPMGARLIAPPLHLLAEAHDKHRFIERCAALGLPVPATARVTSAGDLAAHAASARDLVFKPVWSRFATRTLVRPSPARVRRLSPTQTDPWIVQEALTGDEISAWALARNGRVVALAAYRGLARAGRGAAVAFAPVADPTVRAFVRRYVEGTGWEGQIAFDLMRLPDGRVLPLECNPRATSGVHFFNEPCAFRDTLVADGPEVFPDVTRPQGVRLALRLYGLPMLLQRGGPARYAHALAQTEDVLATPTDPAPGRAQWGALAEFAGIALRQRIGLQAATTHDIEWNGQS